MRALFNIWLSVVLLQGVIASAAYSGTTTLRCSDIPVAFAYENSEDIKCLCSTATSTIAFLKSFGLTTKDCITISVVKNISKGNNSILGSYDSTSQVIRMLEFNNFQKKYKKYFGIDISEDLWCSIAAHELSHAIIDKYINKETKSHTATEYIASVTQLTVLHEDTLIKIINNYFDLDPYRSRIEMSYLYFLIDPNKFAVKCYLHFLSLEKPKDFIKRLIYE